MKLIHFMADETIRNLCDAKLSGNWTQDTEEVTCLKCRRYLKKGLRAIKVLKFFLKMPISFERRPG